MKKFAESAGMALLSARPSAPPSAIPSPNNLWVARSGSPAPGWRWLVGAVGSSSHAWRLSCHISSSTSRSACRCGRVLDRRHGLDPPVEVARHPVGGADVDLLLAAVEEVEGPRVLEEPADDADHPDGLADAGEPRPEAADPAHDQVDRHAGLRGLVQRDDDVGIHQRVHLGDDPRRPSRPMVLDLPADHLEEALPHAPRRHDQLPVPRGRGEAGQHVEEVGEVGAQLGARGQEAEVGVEPRGLRVVVAGADVHVAAHGVALAPHHQGITLAWVLSPATP